MTRVLVTGATGQLGRALVPRLVAAGYAVRALSRRATPDRPSDGVEWVTGDVATGSGLTEAVAGADVLVHGATRPFDRQVDVEGTRRLLAAARTAGVGHVVYPSIVGIDRIPFTYYRHKLAAEAIVRESGVPWSIVRATQFHTLIDMTVAAAARLPVLPLPTDLLFQPVDPGEVAERLLAVIAAGPSGRTPDIGGPVVRPLGDLARAWLTARGRRRPILHIPLPGAVADGFRRGLHTCPGHGDGRVTWEEWLRGTAVAREEVSAR